jgi:hypothetical protein
MRAAAGSRGRGGPEAPPGARQHKATGCRRLILLPVAPHPRCRGMFSPRARPPPAAGDPTAGSGERERGRLPPAPTGPDRRRPPEPPLLHPREGLWFRPPGAPVRAAGSRRRTRRG